jgi:hypothetical protein
VYGGFVQAGVGFLVVAVTTAAGVRLAILKGSRWLRHVVTGTVVAFAVLLWIS